MSRTAKVVRHPRAQADIEEQVDFYLREAHSPQTALRFLDAVEHTLEYLARQPGVGVPCAEGLHGFRRWPLMHFPMHMLFYRERDKVLELVRVLHGARNLDELFGGGPLPARELHD